jgi:hypothetical protein
MSAANALKAALAAGVAVRLDGDDLVLEAAAEPPAAILELLSRYKPAVVALLRPGQDGWSAEDWRVVFDERAGIAEFDGGLSRAAAEASAFTDCVAEWLNRNPMRSPPGRRAHWKCGGGLAALGLLRHLVRRAEGRSGYCAGGDGDQTDSQLSR